MNTMHFETNYGMSLKSLRRLDYNITSAVSHARVHYYLYPNLDEYLYRIHISHFFTWRKSALARDAREL